MSVVKINNTSFEPFIDAIAIQEKVKEVASLISADYQGKNPLFIGVLNGSFRYASDLFSFMDTACEIEFIKVNSYAGTASTGKVKELIGVNGSIAGREIIVVEDIVDTGNTLDFLIEVLLEHEPASIAVTSLLLKPAAYHGKRKIEYVGFEIPNLFVVGYGLDFDGQGRNLNDILQIKN